MKHHLLRTLIRDTFLGSPEKNFYQRDATESKDNMEKNMLNERQLRRIIRQETSRILREVDESASGPKPKLYFLIGPPAVGKTEWIKKQGIDAVVVNRDEMVEKIAKSFGATYDDMFTRPPKEIVPDGMITGEMLKDESKSEDVDAYIEKVKEAADNFNAENPEIVEKFGNLIPFSKEAFETVLIKFGVKPQFIVPFEYEKIKKANDEVTSLLNLTRSDAAKKQKSVIIDMVNMSKNERDQHRRYFVDEITGEKGNPPIMINDFYDQIAIVFAPEEGYSDDLKNKIKEIAALRADEIKSQGGSKTIPAAAYDRMFASYSPPSPEEGFVEIKYVGVPSMEKFSQKQETRLRKGEFLVERWQRLAGLLK